MLSSSIRSWCFKRKIKPLIFLRRTTAVGLFSITNVHAESTFDLEPNDNLALALCDELGSLTRVELYIVSGQSVELCEKAINRLTKDGLLENQEFSKSDFDSNLERLSKEFGSEWKASYVDRIVNRKLILQFRITPTGKEALKSKNKKVSNISDLDIIIMSKPFNLYYDKIPVRSHGFEEIQMSPELTYQVLKLASENNQGNSVKPVSLGSKSISNGREVVNTQFWITVGKDKKSAEKSLKEAQHHLFLSSTSFERWSNPPWNDRVRDSLPEDLTIENSVVNSLENTFDMIAEVVSEELTYDNVTTNWQLNCDLEMLMLIGKINLELIEEISTEVSLTLPNSIWKIVFLLKLHFSDTLAESGLKAARFHLNAPRKGFTQTKGFEVWQTIMNKWDQKSKLDDYLEHIDLLVNHGCLIEILPKIKTLYVDLDNVLSHDRRSSQSWILNRFRVVKKQIDELKIKNVHYMASNDTISRVDETDAFEQLIQDGVIEIFDSENQEFSVPISKAAEGDAHYLGNQIIPKQEQFRKLRINSRKIAFRIDNGYVSIPRLEPFYEYKVENLLDKMYKEYYE